jgi:1,4-dihydroxy-2-naphthoate octaprenyltransferase
MSSPFVTVTPNDPSYRQYLLGDFSKTLRAIPVESFSQHSRRERVTFRLVPIADIKKPNWIKIYFKACRPELLGLTLGPFFVAAMSVLRLFHLPLLSAPVFVSAALGLFFLHVAAFLFNDFRDHIRGVDFANRRRGSQVIQKGWVSAREVRGWAYVNAALALLCGTPAVILFWPKLSVIILLAAAFVLGLSWISSKMARFGVSDMMVFLGLGPLLTGASALVVSGRTPPEIWLLGTALGALAVLTLQVRQLENLFRAGRDSFRTFIGAFDFDRARHVVMGQLVFVGVLQIAMAIEILPHALSVAGFVLALLPLYFVYQPIRRAASPLSSDLVHIGRRAILAQTALLFWWGAAVWI